MFRIFISILFFNLLFFNLILPVSAQMYGTGCNWSHGGYVYTCAEKASRLPRGHPVHRGRYASAGVMALYNAGCVERGSVFMFHSAFYPQTGQLSRQGNNTMEYFLSQWPQLLNHLQYIGAFKSTTMISMTADELSHYGIPLCH